MSGAVLLLLLILSGAVAVLYHKVQRLERILDARGRQRSQTGFGGDPKVIPLLKEQIEPGPFKKGNEKRSRGSQSDPSGH